ncbi:hypothetical protein [Cupriavidus necator]
MVVRRTESRIPSQLQASDLGSAVVSGDGHCALVSFVTSPIVVNRDNVYVVFVTDPALAASAALYEWTMSLDGGAPDVRTTPHGELSCRPPASGSLHLLVRILDAGSAEQARLEMTQDVVGTSAALEALIESARNEQGPTVVNPDVARELVNEHNHYYQNVALGTPEPGDGFKTFVFTMVHDGALEQDPDNRRQRLDRIAASLNDEEGDFATLAAGGFGVCAIRMGLLAMTTPTSAGASPALAWTELPESGAPHASAEAQLRQALGALDVDTRTDLFNRARFPKSNITQCGRILETLRDRYFGGVAFNDVLTGMSGTRAHWIVRHYREGPLHHE